MPMVSVILTLCGILILIGWLTGFSRNRQSDTDPDVQIDVAEEALGQLPAEGLPPALRKGESVSRVLYNMLVGLGMEPTYADGTLRGLGYAVPREQEPPTSETGELTVVSLKDEYARGALERALLVGVQLARMDDDYAHVSDGAASFEALRQRADDVERSLFDDRRRARLDFFSRAVIVLQDHVQSEADAELRSVIAQVLTHFDEALTSLQEEMSRTMAALSSEDKDLVRGDGEGLAWGSSEGLAWGDSEDRRRYYFKMGVTNSLRRSGHLSSLGHLYRFRGVNYDVEEAFQLAGAEEPLLLRAANLEFLSLISLRLTDVRRMTNERQLNRPFSQTES